MNTLSVYSLSATSSVAALVLAATRSPLPAIERTRSASASARLVGCFRKSRRGAKRKPSLRVALLLQLLLPCAAGRGRAALVLVPHREHPLDDLEILRAAPVVEGEAAAVEDLAHGEREDLEALDEGLVVRVVDVDDDSTITIPTGFLP